MTSRQESGRREPAGSTRGLGLALLAIVAGTGLTGCLPEKSMSDLQNYVSEMLARPGQRPEELPPIKPYVIYAYQSVDGVDPFEPFYVEPPEPPQSDKPAGSGLKPDTTRNQEELEQHALDSLRMMGTLELGDGIWGIVRSPDSVIHRVQVGNYVGRNYGKIIGISEESIDLMEIVPDGQGGWVEREASLALTE